MNRHLMLGVLLSLSVVMAEAREVTGSVKCGKEKIEGAVVTDGIQDGYIR